MEEEYLTIKEFANLTKLHPGTIRRLITEKKINASKLGDSRTSHYRISKLEFDKLLVKQPFGVKNGRKD